MAYTALIPPEDATRIVVDICRLAGTPDLADRVSAVTVHMTPLGHVVLHFPKDEGDAP